LCKKALRDLDSRTFDLAEFEVFVDYLQAHRDHRLLEEQRRAAGELGVKHKSLVLEFRRELTMLRDSFVHHDATACGKVDENATWVALNSLGLVPRSWEQKCAFLQVIARACLKAREAEEEQHAPFVSHLQPSVSRRISIASLLVRGTEEDGEVLGELDFEEFLGVLSRVRSWLQQSMREELQPLFDRCLRRRGSSSSRGSTLSYSESAVLGIPEVCMALEDLEMAPTSAKEQQQVSHLLEDTNEWGFEPLTLDFEAFVRFIRRLREWRARIERARERAFAVEEMGLSEKFVNQHRVAFDVLDREAAGELDITGVRKIFLKLNFNISSEQLRYSVAKVDQRQTGYIRFLEYLRLVHDFNSSTLHNTQYQDKDNGWQHFEVVHSFELGRRQSFNLSEAINKVYSREKGADAGGS